MLYEIAPVLLGVAQILGYFCHLLLKTTTFHLKHLITIVETYYRSIT